MPRRTIKDIASRAGVSIGAVSYALNGRPGVSDATRARILAVAAELGWIPNNAARGLAGARTETTGLVLPAGTAETLGVSPYYMEFIAGVETVLAEHGYGLLLPVVPDVPGEIATYNRWQGPGASTGCSSWTRASATRAWRRSSDSACPPSSRGRRMSRRVWHACGPTTVRRSRKPSAT